MSNSAVLPLPNHRACEALTASAIQHFDRTASSGRRREFERGEEIWQPEDPADRIYFIERGQVAIIATDAEGREFIMRVAETGDPFGELCFCSVTDSRRHCFSRAMTATKVLEVSYDDFYAFLQTNRQALLQLTYTFCIRLSEAEERLDILTHRNADARLGRLLVSLATAGAPDPRAPQIPVRVSHAELAQRAAMNRSHVTVTLGRFRKLGLVHYQRGEPLLINVQKLMIHLQLDPNRRSRNVSTALL